MLQRMIGLSYRPQHAETGRRAWAAVGPGCVKKASYRHRAQNSAGIRALNAIFLESILRAARDAPWGLC
jgi:hypothetical protein